jgi:hypothetical protein
LGLEVGQQPSLPPAGQGQRKLHPLGIHAPLALEEGGVGSGEHLVGLAAGRVGEGRGMPAEGAGGQQVQAQVPAMHGCACGVDAAIGAQLEVAAAGLDGGRAAGEREQDRVEGVLGGLGRGVETRRADIPGQPRLEEPGLLLGVRIGGQV